jgi:hypothetical protein
MKGPAAILAGVFLFVLTASSAFASHDRAVELTRVPTGAVHAGDVIEIRWAAHDRDVEELELLLSVDGGKHFAIRVSPELEARDGHWRWRVPNLPAAEASLRVRYGNEHGESLGDPTASFQIVAAAEPGGAHARRETAANAAPSAGDLVHEPGWWSARDALPARASGAGFGADRASIQSAAASSPFAPPRRDSAAAPNSDVSNGEAISPMPAARPVALDLSASPRFIPLKE